MKKKTFWEKLSSKAVRKAIKTFIILIIVFALFTFIFIEFSLEVKENLEKEDKEPLVDTENIKIEEDDKLVVANISISP